MRNRLGTNISNGLVAAGVSLTFLALGLVSANSSEAGSPAQQDAVKVQIKVETKVEKKVEKQVEAKKVDAGAKPIAKEAAVPAVAVEAFAVDVGVADIAVVNGPPGNAEGMAKAFLQQYRPILETELRVLTSSCEPTPPQRREIAIEGGRALKKASVKMAEVQQGMMQGRGVNEVPDPRQIVRDAMKNAAKSKLSAEQLGRYQKELETRAKDQRESVMYQIVASLDQLLLLTVEQRQKLCDSLMAHWDDINYPTIETVTIYEGYYPMIPNQHINPILNEEQKTIWGTAMKIQFGSVRNFAFFNNMQMNGGGAPGGAVAEDEDVKAAFAEEVKK